MRLVLEPLHSPEAEYAAVTEEPISAELQTYFEVRSFAFPDRPTADRLPPSVRLAAVGGGLKRRLTVASDVVRRLEASGWEVHFSGRQLVASKAVSAQEGWAELRAEGIADHLLPLLERGSDLPPGPGRRGRAAGLSPS